MSDPSQKPGSIPSWQREQQSQEEGSSGVVLNQSSTSSIETLPRAALLDKASKFLEDDEIREASTESKISFLEGKGLTSDEIQKLLGASWEEKDVGMEVRATSVAQEDSKPTNPIQTGKQSIKTLGSFADAASKDIPPIITYPEFLLHSQKLPPLITAKRLLTAAYIISGAAALTYGTSKFIVEPMIETLTSARRSLFECAGENLHIMNEKLEKAVSVVPDDNKPAPLSEEDAEVLEATAFFHRSAGTQTSPHLSHSNSSSSESPEEPSATTSQSARLQDLEENLKDLLKPEQLYTSDPEARNHISNNLDEFKKYLDRLMYGNAKNIPGFAGNNNKEDSIATVKAEIRQTKGVLLSSRNFPSSVGIKGWGAS